ncbi:energy transducer TonB [Microbulbifer bruguierae]|uniref:Energy transducer TonB n=1 Tax=Microbulbifer bruguierae TaxID=3029061 RepID=A0ABY8NHL0_9GAMM|nr:energy transducer TonB [Microbulbifer bruguierae]WGL18411.1 energy transducer TonB [Microbulbifer bruguierae]
MEVRTSWLKNTGYVLYPWEARERGIEGFVVVSFTIAENGEIIEGSIAESSGSKLLDNSALEAISTFEVDIAALGDVEFPHTKKMRFKFRMAI